MYKIPKVMALSSALLLPVTFSAWAGETPSPDGAKAYIINVEDGARVTSPLFLQFGLSGMGIAPAGVDDKADTGHHHLFINDTLSEDEVNDVIPADDAHIHYGGGQTEASIELAPGEYTLQLVLGDWSHIPHNPPVISNPITITVE
ncbi:uncharacterized protein DUF4399 [Roseibium hamelinense]|uniref:Uncharacterized protein DUF4399 n=1 Tax=Roseibium hamelinense TaxID=150831 RepID=A0A562SF94_9HYPH|nr:DUF4399 domain-containing protein [Roseibium hamelinense]MTI42876.1 DUF4399 domain-containing protein [Roseibium hamelinense]TWI79908.1 uncharacterized protein DUF4399 [Roseibium hamelinense]